MLFVRKAVAHVATPIILGQRHSEVECPALFFAEVWLTVIDQYPFRLGEPKKGRQVRGANPKPFAM